MGASYLRDAVHLGRWATGHGIPIEALDEQAIDGFRSHLKACDCAHVGRGSHGRSANRVCVFLEYLRKAGVAAPAVAMAGPPRSPVLDEFEDWLRQQRGATAATIRAYRRWVSGLIDRLGEDPTAYTPQALRAAVVALAAGPCRLALRSGGCGRLSWTPLPHDPILIQQDGRSRVMLGLSDEGLRGRTVIASDALAIGSIALLFIDSDGWRLGSLQAKLRKDTADRLGAG